MTLDIVEQAALTSGLLIVASGLAVWLLRKRLAAQKALEPGSSVRIERAQLIERSIERPGRSGRRGDRAELRVDGHSMTLHVPRTHAVDQIAYADVARATLERVNRRDVLRFEVADTDRAWEWMLSPAETTRITSWLAHVGVDVQRLL